jgi:antirestriction protein
MAGLNVAHQRPDPLQLLDTYSTVASQRPHAASPTDTEAMDIDPKDIVDEARKSSPGQGRSARLNALVAITVALLATFMGICKVKDDNIVQAMQQAQADKLDHWAFYQARNVRQDLAESTATQLRLARLGKQPTEAAAYDEAIARYDAQAADQKQKKDALKGQAEQDQKTYDSLNFRDDQFDLSDAALAISIALLAVTALTQLWWLYAVALAPTCFGLLMGLSGLMGLPIHPDTLVRMLS